MLPVTLLMVTAVWTRELTASIRLARVRSCKFSFFFRMALPAYILAMSLWPCDMAWTERVSGGRGGKARGRRGKGQTYLLELRLLGLFIFAGFGGLAVELLGCELRVVDGVSVRRAGGEEEEEEMEVAFARDAP